MIVPLAAAPLRGAQHALPDEARLLQRTLLGEVGAVRPGLKPFGPGVVKEVLGQQSLGLGTYAAAVRGRYQARTSRRQQAPTGPCRQRRRSSSAQSGGRSSRTRLSPRARVCSGPGERFRARSAHRTSSVRALGRDGARRRSPRAVPPRCYLTAAGRPFRRPLPGRHHSEARGAGRARLGPADNVRCLAGQPRTRLGGPSLRGRVAGRKPRDGRPSTGFSRRSPSAATSRSWARRCRRASCRPSTASGTT